MTDARFYAPPLHPTLAAAGRAVAAAPAEARTGDLAVAVVAASCHPLCLHRIEAARPDTAAMAQAKAWTAMINPRDAAATLPDMAAPDVPAFGLQHQFPGLGAMLAGGVPVASSAWVHAAAGVSGADGSGDVGCAEAAAAELSRPMRGQDRGQD